MIFCTNSFPINFSEPILHLFFLSLIVRLYSSLYSGVLCLILQGARNEIFAMQPAPIQISYMGFPGTTGASYIHYLVTDEVGRLNF